MKKSAKQLDAEIAAALGSRSEHAKKRAFDPREEGVCLDDLDDPLVFYHATPTQNVPSIVKHGLRPGGGETFSTQAWSKGKLFIAYGLKAGREWLEDIHEQTGLGAVTLFEVRLTPDERDRLKRDHVARKEGDSCTFYATFPIASRALRIVDSIEAA